METKLFPHEVCVAEEGATHQLGWLDPQHADYDGPNGAPRPLAEAWSEGDAEAVAHACNSYDELLAALLGAALEIERAGGNPESVRHYRAVAQTAIDAQVLIIAKGGAR